MAAEWQADNAVGEGGGGTGGRRKRPRGQSDDRQEEAAAGKRGGSHVVPNTSYWVGRQVCPLLPKSVVKGSVKTRIYCN